eukprot:TRINITY_DN19_c0_g1_i1.p1 TRINITY_DN19_c0_g1~~TRINITY_DN19_c0_g1_i1.p1  ORF type:complete len:829 (+),score=125.00 TRINITY_DN19_c0_g1_i1:62-2548(+)
MCRIKNSIIVALALLCLVGLSNCQQISVDTHTITQKVSPDLFGIFYEEINHAGYGGIYAELVQNRDFEAPVSDASFIAANPTQPLKDVPFNQYISLQSVAHPTFFVRHCDYLAYISGIANTQDRKDSTFLITPSLLQPSNAHTISFESLDFPGYYLRHQNFRLHLEQNDGSQQFKFDSSFSLVPAKHKSYPNAYMFESINYPNYYLNFNSQSDPQTCPNLGTKYDIFLSPFVNSSGFILNSTFAFTKPDFVPTIPAWSASASNPNNQKNIALSITHNHPLTPNATASLLVNISNSFTSKGSSDYVYIQNTGYWGMNIVAGQSYNFSFYIRRISGPSSSFEFDMWLQRADGGHVSHQYTFGFLGPFNGSWEHSYGVIQPTISDSNCSLIMAFRQGGLELGLDFVSLFPHTTFKNSPNGNRVDLMNLVADLRPKFVRFPGGCYIEGNSMLNSYQWKKTIGPLPTRPGHQGVWNYWSNDGMGYYEYLRWIEQIGAKAIWVFNIGISFTEYIPLAQLGPQIQDAIDSIEFANGDPKNNYWASLRAQYGHPEPFNLSIMALGNEDCYKFPLNVYTDRANAFASAIKSRYPYMKLIVNCQQALTSLNTSQIDFWDYHVYSSADWFINNRDTFKNYPTTGPRVFVSEYAMTSNAGIGNLIAAISEAAFMTGLVKYSHAAPIASYAPLFVNVNDRYWNPDAIQFNSSSTAPTPSYWTQKLFSLYTGSGLLATKDVGLNNMAYVATRGVNEQGREVVWLTTVNWEGNAKFVDIALSGGRYGNNVVVRRLSGSSPGLQNTLANPHVVVPVTTNLPYASPLRMQFPAYSLIILEFTISS